MDKHSNQLTISGGRAVWMVAMCFALAGCASVPMGSGPKEAPAWTTYYQEAQRASAPIETAPEEMQRLTLSVDAMPLTQFLRYLSQETGISIIAESDLDWQLVTMEIQDQTVDSILQLAARRLGVEISGQGNLYFVGKTGPEDRAILVRQVGRLTSDEIEQAIGVVLSTDGRVIVYPDGVAVVADSVEMLRKVEDVLVQVEAVEGAVWVVQFYLIQDSGSTAKEQGVQATFDAEVSASLVDSVALGAVTETGYKFNARAAFKRQLSDSQTRVEARPLFLLLDGTEGKMRIGETVPVARKTVSPEGTVQTVGYENIDVGLDVLTMVREGAGNSATLSYAVTLGEITGYVEAAPIVSEQAMEGQTRIASGGTYLLGRLQRSRSSQEASGVIWSGEYKAEKANTGDLMLWAIVERVAGAALSPF